MTATRVELTEDIELAAGLTVPLELVTATIAVLANRGGGKSAFAHHMVERMYHAGLATVVLDVKGDWYGIRTSADGIGPGLPFVIFGGEHGDVALEPDDGEVLADLIVDDRIPAVVDLSHMRRAQQRSFATSFAERLYRRNRDPLHIVIEEADVLVPQRVSSDTAQLIEAMEDLAKRGRHRGIGMTLVSQRAQDVAKSVLDLMETVVLLRMSGARSIKAVQDWISVQADPSDAATVKEVISSLPALTTGAGWLWSPGFLGILTRVSFPLFETFDSHRTPKPGQVRVVPRTRADIDLVKLGAEIAATRERVHDDQPQAPLIRAPRGAQPGGSASADRDLLIAQLAERDDEIRLLRRQVADLSSVQRRQQALEASLQSIASIARDALAPNDDAVPASGTAPAADTEAPPVPSPSTPPPPAETPHNAKPPAAPRRTRRTPSAPIVDRKRAGASDDPDRPFFRKGARTMLTTLARMAPLRVTEAQWALLTHLKGKKSGTWRTYLSELRREGLLDESSVGFTLSAAGWRYIGPRPEPMDYRQLQQHYLGVLRLGASKMLQTAIDAYPDNVGFDSLSEASGIIVGTGTWRTYLSELRRYGLIEDVDGGVRASAMLMFGDDGAASA